MYHKFHGLIRARVCAGSDFAPRYENVSGIASTLHIHVRAGPMASAECARIRYSKSQLRSAVLIYDANGSKHFTAHTFPECLRATSGCRPQKRRRGKINFPHIRCKRRVIVSEQTKSSSSSCGWFVCSACFLKPHGKLFSLFE